MVAELVGEASGNLVALRILRQDLLEEQLGAALVVDVVRAPAVVFEFEGFGVELVGLDNVGVAWRLGAARRARGGRRAGRRDGSRAARPRPTWRVRDRRPLR